MPDHLSDAAKEEWKRISQELYSLGLLAKTDRSALASYCEAWADFVSSTSALKREEKIIETTHGNMIINPQFTIKNRSMLIMHKFLTEFGMSPASRTRISAKPKADKPQSAWSAFGAKKA
jgi:P27 family predicted phage terminase small subunit